MLNYLQIILLMYQALVVPLLLSAAECCFDSILCENLLTTANLRGIFWWWERLTVVKPHLFKT